MVVWRPCLQRSRLMKHSVYKRWHNTRSIHSCVGVCGCGTLHARPLKKRGFLFVVLRSQISTRCTHQSVLITTELFLCGKNKTLICKLETGNRSSNSEIRRRNAPLWNADWKTIRISLNNSDHKLTTFKNVYIEPEVGNTSANFVTTFDFSPLTSERKYIWTFFFFFPWQARYFSSTH